MLQIQHVLNIPSISSTPEAAMHPLHNVPTVHILIVYTAKQMVQINCLQKTVLIPSTALNFQ